MEYLIIKSKDSSEFLKQVCLLLIDRSVLLSKAVCIELSEPRLFKDLIQMGARGIHDMHSSQLSTHLDAVMNAMCTNFHFSHHVGHYDEEGKFLSHNSGAYKFAYTIWLSSKTRDHSAEKIRYDYETIKLIDLVPKLYIEVEV